MEVWGRGNIHNVSHTRTQDHQDSANTRQRWNTTQDNLPTPRQTLWSPNVRRQLLVPMYQQIVNNSLYQCTNRPNAQTPSAFTWHLRYGCKCASVLKHNQHQVEGLKVRQVTLNDLSKLLPCSACLAGKARKAKKQPVKNFTDTANLAITITNAPLSWAPNTEHKVVEPNQTVSHRLGHHQQDKQSRHT